MSLERELEDSILKNSIWIRENCLSFSLRSTSNYDFHKTPGVRFDYHLLVDECPLFCRLSLVSISLQLVSSSHITVLSLILVSVIASYFFKQVSHSQLLQIKGKHWKRPLHHHFHAFSFSITFTAVIIFLFRYFSDSLFSVVTSFFFMSFVFCLFSHNSLPER